MFIFFVKHALVCIFTFAHEHPFLVHFLYGGGINFDDYVFLSLAMLTTTTYLKGFIHLSLWWRGFFPSKWANLIVSFWLVVKFMLYLLFNRKIHTLLLIILKICYGLFHFLSAQKYMDRLYSYKIFVDSLAFEFLSMYVLV